MWLGMKSQVSSHVATSNASEWAVDSYNLEGKYVFLASM